MPDGVGWGLGTCWVGVVGWGVLGINIYPGTWGAVGGGTMKISSD